MKQVHAWSTLFCIFVWQFVLHLHLFDVSVATQCQNVQTPDWLCWVCHLLCVDVCAMVAQWL